MVSHTAPGHLHYCSKYSTTFSKFSGHDQSDIQHDDVFVSPSNRRVLRQDEKNILESVQHVSKSLRQL